MRPLIKPLLCAATLALATAAQAMPSGGERITNGGTGFIGVTASAGMPREAFVARAPSGATTSVPSQAGEASTFVQGQPNRDPAATGNGPSSSTMGAAPSSMAAPATQATRAPHRLWGTPD